MRGSSLLFFHIHSNYTGTPYNPEFPFPHIKMLFAESTPLRESKTFARSCLLMLRHGPENGKAILAVPKVVYPLLRSMNFTVHSLNVQWNSVFLIYSFPLLRLLFWLCWRYLGRGSRLCLRGAGGGRRSWFGLRLRGLL